MYCYVDRRVYETAVLPMYRRENLVEMEMYVN